MNSKKALIIFVRNPEKGKVKTRLAATIGDDAALHVYKKLLSHTFNVSSDIDADKFVFYAGAVCTDDIWQGPRFYKQSQADGSLGDKMMAAFSAVFNKGYNEVVIIGSDCPQLTSQHINAAFQHLLLYDVLIGPARDGGYYLLGMKKLYAAFFENKAWSTDRVFEDTIKDMKQHALSFGVLETLADVDEEKDLPQSWKTEVKNLFHLT